MYPFDVHGQRRVKVVTENGIRANPNAHVRAMPRHFEAPLVKCLRNLGACTVPAQWAALKIPALAPHYEIIVTKDGNMDNVLVKVEMTPDAQDVDPGPVVKELQHHIKSVVGISTRIDVVPVGGLARSEGKAKRVSDLR